MMERRETIGRLPSTIATSRRRLSLSIGYGPCRIRKKILKNNWQDKDVPQGTPICLTVYYDLEADRDYVKIYSGDAKEPEMQELVVQ